MTLLKSDFLRPFTFGFAAGAVMVAAKFAMELNGHLA